MCEEERDFRTEVEDNFLTCPVCYEHYSEDTALNPHILFCGHTLCKCCINQIIRTKVTPQCPFCNEPMFGLYGTNAIFPKNFMVLSMLSFFPKIQQPIHLIRYMQQDIDKARASICQAEEDVEYYAKLIAENEEHMKRLHHLYTQAQNCKELAQSNEQHLQKTITEISENESSAGQGPLQCRMVAPVDEPLRHGREDWLSDIRRGRSLSRNTTNSTVSPPSVSFGAPPPPFSLPPPPPPPPTVPRRNTMQDELRHRLAMRRRVIQPSVVIPDEPNRRETGSLSELARVFQRRQEGVQNWAAREPVV